MLRNNFLICGRSLLLYQFKINAIKLTVVIIVEYHFYNFIQNVIQCPSLKVKSMYVYI
jgi:hypothetical protein